jgi:phosphoglucomutase
MASVSLHPLAGHLAPPDLLIDVVALERAYYTGRPDPADARQAVVFGTSGHRGSPLDGSFTEAHVLAMTQAICDHRRRQRIAGPLLLGKDTHAVSRPAERTALEVLAANGVETVLQRDDGVTPTPVISHAILVHNRAHPDRLADGIVITPSHNPPGDGGFKYNPPHGGPAESEVTSWIQERANALLRDENAEVKRVSRAASLTAATTHPRDFLEPYVADLPSVVDLDAIRDAGLVLGVDPLGGTSGRYWQAIADVHDLAVVVTNPAIDPTFRFMTLDHDGKIRMDCSSPSAMATLSRLKDRFDLAVATDPDADRHGIVTRSAGLLNPNHYLAVAIHYLLGARKDWRADVAVGKTMVSSSMIDRVVAGAGRALAEVPVGFKWFVPGLGDGSCCFAGEESAGASFLRRDGTAWTTDKDGLLLALLAAEITARTGKDPAVHYQTLTAAYGATYYIRLDTPATPAQKAALLALTPEAVRATTLAGEPIVAKLTRAPVNGAPLGGIKIVAASGWFAARPSGTEDVYKLYAESFRDASHRDAIVGEAERILAATLSRT